MRDDVRPIRDVIIFTIILVGVGLICAPFVVFFVPATGGAW